MRKKQIGIFSIIPVGMLMLSLSGCSSEANSKNMEQLHAEQGVPAKTEIVSTSSFAKGFEYNAVITGVEESSAFSSLSDRVENINYNIGDIVKKDAVVLTFPMDNPAAQYYQAKLTYENASATYTRMKSFYESGGLSLQDYENAQTSFRIAEANWNDIQQSVEVRAPISGVITRINIRETENVNKDDELFTVERTDKVKARVWVADKEIEDVRVGQKAIAEWSGDTINGKVVQVDLSMNQNRKAFAVDIVFDNDTNKFRTGVTAKVTIFTYNNNESISIQRKNLFNDHGMYYVYLNNNGFAKKQIVELGESNAMDVEIVDGLIPGDQLIVEGQMLLKDNTKLNLITDTSRLDQAAR